tara:strand:- start:122 stop:769 length:648 start_codon:yes stop_codon:yes gene_type:complete
MPNHCYAWITVQEKYEKKLQEIAKVGLCRYYRPMPEELVQTTSPTRVVTEKEYAKQMKENETAKFKSYPITKDRRQYLLDNYGYDNWYDWAYKNWGTKWGCYDNECDDGMYRFTSAWGPIDDSIIELLSKDIPTFSYSYEEEQGWGAEFEVEDGEIVNSLEWETPDWEETDHDDIQYLSNDYENGEGKFSKGYYNDYCLSDYLGGTIEESIEEIT